MTDTEHIEYLGKGINLYVSDSHTFGTDALLLADFTSPRRKDIVCDFGSGCGIIPFYWLKEGMGDRIYAVEIQKNGFDLIKKSVGANGAENKIIPLNTDLRDLKNADYAGKFDVISMNPPYTPDGAGIKSRSESAKIARHETVCSLDEICLTASRLLKFGGRVCMCLRPERLCELMFSMKNAGIEPKRMRLVSQSVGKAPWLVLLEGKKGRKPGLCVEKELYIEQNGELSEDMIRIMGSYREENGNGSD